MPSNPEVRTAGTADDGHNWNGPDTTGDAMKIVMIANAALVGIPAAYAASNSAIVTVAAGRWQPFS